jgi:hypothetical protein
MMQEQHRSITRLDGMYGMSFHEGMEIELGGPFQDIDDLLDVCFNHLMATDLSIQSVFYIHVKNGLVEKRQFPVGAFPTDDEVSV